MGSQAGAPDWRPLEERNFAAEIVVPSQRDQLIAAMAAICAERGFRAASVEEVVGRAGLERADFERHFNDEADCAVAAANQMLADITAVTTAAYVSEASALDGIVRSVLALLELLAARPNLARLACVEARHSMPPEGYEVYATAIRVLIAMLDRLRAYACAGTPPSSLAVRAGVGGAEILIRRELRAGRGDRLPELLPDVVYGLLVPFLDRDEALRRAELARELVNEGR